MVRPRGINPAVKTFATKTDANRCAPIIGSEIDRGVLFDRSQGELIDCYLTEVTQRK